MIRFLLVVFAVVIFVLLAGQWVISGNSQQWRDGAFAAFALSFIIEGGVTFVVSRTRRQDA